MSYCSLLSPKAVGRSPVLCVISAALALVISFGLSGAVFAQAKSAPKAADRPADDEPQAQQPQELDAKVLIGDAVEDADSPQYRKVAAAIDRFRELRAKDARDLLTEARTTHPQLPPAEVLMAKLFIVARQPQLAMAELEQAVRRHPRDPEAYLILADGSLAEQRISAAEALYQKSEIYVRSFTENPKRKENFEKRVLHGLAAVAEHRQQWSTAETLLRQWIKLDPKNANAHQRLGRAVFQQSTPSNNKWNEAYDAYVAASKLDPKAIKPDVAMGQLFEQAAQEASNAGENARFKDYRDRATKYFQRATAGNADLNSLLAAALWAMQTNQLRLGQQYAEAAMKADAQSLEARMIAAIVARFSGDLATAERLLNEAFNDHPGNIAVSNQLALVLVDTQNKSKQDRALQLAEMNFRQYQNNAEAASTLGWVYYRLGRRAEAMKVLQAVVNSGQVSPDSAYYVAKVLADDDRNAEAMQVLQTALANPQPFANRVNAANLQAEVRKEMEEQGSGKGNTKTSPTSTNSGGARPPARGTK